MAFSRRCPYGARVIDVALTPVDLRPARLAVVIDVLRATSTATQALASGYRRVLVAETIERALELRTPGRVLAGERQGIKPPGFDQGNSPAEAGEPRGHELVLATTNGGPAVVAATRDAPQVMLACLLNLDAAIRSLRTHDGEDVLIVCSGTDGAVALEDVYVAGRLSAALPGERSDAARVAEAVARAFGTPLDALDASSDAARLRAIRLAKDIADCAVESTLDVVPAVTAAGGGFATVCAVAGGEPAPVVDQGDTVGV